MKSAPYNILTLRAQYDKRHERQHAAEPGAREHVDVGGVAT